MKYTIFSLFTLILLSACQEVRQEEQASYSDFFMSRSDHAKSIKDQNYSAQPERMDSPIKQEEVQTSPADEPLEGIILESQEEAPAMEPAVNGATETEYLKDQQQQEDRHHLNTDEKYFEQEKEVEEDKFVTPDEVRSWTH